METYTVALIGGDGDRLIAMRVALTAGSEDEAYRKVWALLSADARRRMRIVPDWDDNADPDPVLVAL